MKNVFVVRLKDARNVFRGNVWTVDKIKLKNKVNATARIAHSSFPMELVSVIMD